MPGRGATRRWAMSTASRQLARLEVVTITTWRLCWKLDVPSAAGRWTVASPSQRRVIARFARRSASVRMSLAALAHLVSFPTTHVSL